MPKINVRAMLDGRNSQWHWQRWSLTGH